MRYLFVCLLLTARWVLVAAALFLPAAAFAHGVDSSDVTGRAGVRTVRFGYTDGESMLFAKVKVYPPSTPDATVQESMTDRDGYFSFVPFEDGDWRLTAEDGMGHRGEIVVAVSGTAQGELIAAQGERIAAQGEWLAEQNASSSNKLPRPIAIVLGLSLILNVFVFYHFALKKSAGKKEASGAH